ncbi:MAG: preprotein translocase subunit SecY, partial [Pseudomonadota bacterium]|nr:preprotein translocase subunit SecY [Pseudomonadota bacterium]
MPPSTKTTKNPLALQGYRELTQRLLFLLGALVVFRLGAHIPVPGINPDRLAQ